MSPIRGKSKRPHPVASNINKSKNDNSNSDSDSTSDSDSDSASTSNSGSSNNSSSGSSNSSGSDSSSGSSNSTENKASVKAADSKRPDPKETAKTVKDLVRNTRPVYEEYMPLSPAPSPAPDSEPETTTSRSEAASGAVRKRRHANLEEVIRREIARALNAKTGSDVDDEEAADDSSGGKRSQHPSKASVGATNQKKTIHGTSKGAAALKAVPASSATSPKSEFTYKQRKQLASYHSQMVKLVDKIGTLTGQQQQQQ